MMHIKVAENYLIDDTENTNKEDEEDPILVAQRYLNIFHQIHIFNATRKAEFDQSLLAMPEKIKELMAAIPGGRVLLEHIKEIEETRGINSGSTSELIAQNIEEEKKSIDNVQQHPTNSGGGTLTLSTDFADSLAKSLATALQNNNVAANGSMNELAAVLNKSFNAYASNMQNLTNTIMRQNTMQTSIPVTSNGNTAAAPVAAQQNLQNNNSTTVNNINIDSSYFDSINRTLMQNDERRHEDMMQIVSAINKNIVASGFSPLAATAINNSVSSDVPATAIANSVTEALRQNNSQQMEAIKAFGEMLVQAITQSQQELAQTIAQSTPRHTVKVVVSQDVDIDDQTGSTVVNKSSLPQTNKETKNTSPAKNNLNKDNSNFMKSFSDKINETTNKIAKNFETKTAENNQNKQSGSDTLLNRINKSLNKINEIKKQTEKSFSDLKNDIKEKAQPKPEIKSEPKLQNQPKPEIKNEPKPEPKNEPKPQYQPKPEIKNEPKPQKQPKPEIKNEPKPQNQPKPEIKSEPKPQDQPKPEIKNEPKPQDQPKPEIKSEPKPQNQQKPEPKDESKQQLLTEDQVLSNIIPAAETSNKNNDNLSIDDILASIPTENDETNNTHEVPDIFADNSFSAPQTDVSDLNKTDISKDSDDVLDLADLELNTPKAPESADKQQNTSLQEPAYKKSQLHSYEDALLKIKNALNSDSSDNNVSLNNLDVQPVSLSGDDLLAKTEVEKTQPQNIFSEQPQKLADFDDNDSEWEYVDENGNPVSGDNGEWEYVDENGNPVSGDDSEWEYVDENGNPVSDNDGEWEYVDENGNPVSGNDGEWEYVDENGNPVSDDDEWEYVDENGNPIDDTKKS